MRTFKDFLKDFFVNSKTIGNIIFFLLGSFFLFLVIDDSALIALNDAIILTIGLTTIVFYGKFIRKYKQE